MSKQKELISILEEFPAILRAEINNMEKEELDKVVLKWTVRKIVHHIADSHLNSYIRIKLALTEENPTIKPYNETLWAELADSNGPVDVSLNIIESIHQRIVVILKKLNEKDWNRTITHPEIGSLTLLEYVKIFADHGEGHVRKFRK